MGREVEARRVLWVPGEVLGWGVRLMGGCAVEICELGLMGGWEWGMRNVEVRGMKQS